jgi:hypothetical protein
MRREAVERRVLRHERVDVGDADHHLGRAGRQAFGHFELIEIARGVVVDRRPRQVPEVAHVAAGRHR